MFNIIGKYFFGHKISDYGIEHGYVDYATLAKGFDAVLANDFMTQTAEIGYWEPVSYRRPDDREIVDLMELYEEIEQRHTRATEHMDRCETLMIEEEDKNGYTSKRFELLERTAQRYEDLIAAYEAKMDDITDSIDELENYTPDIFQWYIISNQGADILQECNEIVYYNDTLGLYLWGVTHWGTSWDYVLTDIPCNYGHEEA